jgi:hypothetical protein
LSSPGLQGRSSLGGFARLSCEAASDEFKTEG